MSELASEPLNPPVSQPVAKPKSVPDTPLRTSSLRGRVTWAVLAAMAAVLLSTVVLVNGLFAAFTNRDINLVLSAHTQLAQQLARQNIAPRDLARRTAGGGVATRLVLANGEVFGSLPAMTSEASMLRSRTVALSVPGVLNHAELTLALDTTTVTTARSRLHWLLVVTALGAFAVTGVLLVVIVRVALAPLDAMTRLARTIASGGRGRRLSPTRTDTELGRTAAAFDDMLDALEGAERQAKLAETASRVSEESTRRFVADAAHELRTPIAGVQALAEAVLQQAGDADPADRERLYVLLVRESRRAGQLVEDLLDLARIDAGIQLQLGPVELRALADTEVERARLLAPEKTIEIHGPPLVVTGDAARITQILTNLLDNARQATAADGRVSVTIGVAGRFAELVVADDGPGVPELERRRIFDRLVRLDDARDRRTGGSGLGLSIALGLARAHRGDLICETPSSAPGAPPGAVFRLALPLDSPATGTPSAASPGIDPPTAVAPEVDPPTEPLPTNSPVPTPAVPPH